MLTGSSCSAISVACFIAITTQESYIHISPHADLEIQSMGFDLVSRCLCVFVRVSAQIKLVVSDIKWVAVICWVIKK